MDINNQVLVINGILEKYDSNDAVETALFQKQQSALQNMPEDLVKRFITMVPLRAYNITGLENIRHMLSYSGHTAAESALKHYDAYTLSDIINEKKKKKKKIIFN